MADRRARSMHACLKCGKGIFEDYIIWKGGINRSLCESCRREEQEKEAEGKERRSDEFG
jgi:hypothetical protein